MQTIPRELSAAKQPPSSNIEYSINGTKWHDALRLRPLIPCAALTVAGCALGLQHPDLAIATPFLSSLSPTVSALLCALLLVVVLWRWKQHSTSRGALYVWVCALFAMCVLWSAQRSVPPHNDISQTVRATASRDIAQRRLQVTLIGWVADHPQNGEFGIEFPLQARSAAHHNAAPIERRNPERLSTEEKPSPTTGRVWMRLPAQIAGRKALQIGDEISVRATLSDLPRAGNEGERSRRARYVSAQCWSIARVAKSEDWKVTQRAARYPLARLVAATRSRLLAHYEKAFATFGSGAPYPLSSAQLLVAMVFGEGGLQESLPRQTRDQFRAAGLSHLLVASGAQVVFLAAALVTLARFAGLRRGWLLLLVVPSLFFYALLAGGSSSIWRATVAGLCIAWALLLGRDTDGLSLWSLALIVLLFIDPTQLHDLGFQLTFAATWGLLVLAPALRPRLERVAGGGWLSQLAALSLGAQLATTPLLLYHVGRISLIGIGTNFIAVPLAALLLLSGVLSLALPLMNLLNYQLVIFIDALAAMAARAPGAQTDAPPLSLGWTLLCYAMLLLALLPGNWNARWNELDLRTRLLFIRHQFGGWWQRKTTKFRPQSFVVALALLLTAAIAWRTVRGFDRSLRVTVLDVGQGESILIQSASGRTVLIDGGTQAEEGRGEVGRAVIVPYLRSRGVRRIDALVLTHADSDHCNALAAVLREIPVKMVIDGAASRAELSGAPAQIDASSAADYAAVKHLWRERKIPVHAARAGQKLQLGEGAVLTVIAPSSPALRGDNNNGAVLRLDHGSVGMLLTGDIEREAEERLLRRGANLKCTVLKVAHHGSKTSTTPQFLRAARPQVAVMSCGRYNSFGHPAPATLKNLAAQNVATFRTDIDGAVEIVSDGRACWIQTFR